MRVWRFWGATVEQHGIHENKQFGSYLRTIREQRKLSLDAVEEMSVGYPERITKSHLSRIENGQAVPTFPRMFALSQIYGVPVASMAERFEVDLLRGMTPEDLRAMPPEELRAQGKRLRIAGRYREALQIYDTLLEIREAGHSEMDSESIDVALFRVACLVKLNRNLAARDECEVILNGRDATPQQRTQALYYFAWSCLQMGNLATACMVLEETKRTLDDYEAPLHIQGNVAGLEGYARYALGEYAGSAESFTRAVKHFEEGEIRFEACRHRINLAGALIRADQLRAARTHLKSALDEARAKGYDRQQAQAMNALGAIAFAEGRIDVAEAHCLQSNQIARPRDFYDVIFANCFYLWRIAGQRGDPSGAALNERTLRAYLSRVDPFLTEVAEYRKTIAGGDQ